MNQSNTGFLNSIPPVTRNIIIINVLAWLAQFLLGRSFDIEKYFALHYFESSLFMPHQVITHMFLHDPNSPMHLFFNMFAVFMFGRTLEMVLGQKKFFIYYILTGIGAAALHMLIAFFRIKSIEAGLSPDLVAMVHQEGAGIIAMGKNYTDPALGSLNAMLNGSMLGASGAVFGILVAFGMLFPNAELMMLFFPVPIKAKWFVIGYGVLELLLGISNNAADNVAHFAHLGGLITGFLIMLYWRKKAMKDGHF